MDVVRATGMTPEERVSIEELKKRLKDEIKPEFKNDDVLFLRFLRARNWNISKAEKMLKNHFQWREKNDIDNIGSYQPPEVWKYFPISFIGYDKSGTPIRYFDYGKEDVKGLLKALTVDEYIKGLTQALESDEALMKKKSEELNELVHQWTYVLNFENYQLSSITYRPAFKKMMKVVSVLEQHYPERMKTVYAINAPKSFTIVYNICKAVATERSLNKMKIFGKDGWKEELLKAIDADVLPAFLGGNRTDPDGNPNCISFISQGGVVPKSYYKRNISERVRNQSGVKKLKIPSKTKETVVLEVDESGCMIEWDIETEEGDIEFCIDFMAKDGASEEVLPKQRIEGNEIGTLHCEKTGKYVISLDNSYDHNKDKTIFYRAVVVKAKDESKE